MPDNISVAAEKCDGCGACLQACPFFAIEVAVRAVIAESCVECGICIPACPTGAIIVRGGESERPGRGAIWVYLPNAPAGLGALTAARGLADELDAKVVAVVSVAEDARLFAAGADEVIALKALKGDGPPHSMLAEAVRRETPVAVLGLAAGNAGLTLARAAAALGFGFVAGATEVSVSFSDRSLEFVRPIFGGRFSTRLAPADRGRTVLATLDARVFRRERRNGAKGGRSRILEVPGVAEPVEVLGEREGRRKTELSAARTVIAGGLGLGSAGNFAKLYLLAERLEAMVGADRGAVEAGWASREQLIDIAGTSVAPDLYLAFGIDGSPTHNAAIERSKVIAVVTSNRQANILGMADFILPFESAETLESALASGALG